MTWVINSTIRTILGILGNITAVGLFASPLPTFWRIARHKSTEAFLADPYLLAFFNCINWTFYGLPPVANEILVTTINAGGAVAEAGYLLVFLLYSKGRTKAWTSLRLVAICLFFAALVGIALGALPTPTGRTTLVGVVGVVVTTAMYAAPLSVVSMVIRTRSVEFMPFYLSVNGFVNAVVWLAYAVYVRDLYVGIPNGLGVLFGAVQLVVYFKFYEWKKKAAGVDLEGESGSDPHHGVTPSSQR